jgi:hypothetical protein
MPLSIESSSMRRKIGDSCAMARLVTSSIAMSIVVEVRNNPCANVLSFVIPASIHCIALMAEAGVMPRKNVGNSV